MKSSICPFVLACIGFVLAFTGCASTTGMEEVLEKNVAERTGFEVRWYSGLIEEGSLREQVHALLNDTLNLEDAVRIALLNNRHLQAVYESAGLAQADLIQASLFTNPEADIHVGYPAEGGHDPDLGFSVALNILDVFQRPLRKAVAHSLVEEARIVASREVVALVADVQEAYYTHQAALQLLELHQQVTGAAQASFEAATLLREAGNIPELDLNNNRMFYEQMRLELAYAELAVVESREAMNRVMGVWGDEATQWEIAHRLSGLDELPESLALAERTAIEASFDLAALEQGLQTLAYKEGVVNATALLPQLKVGIDAEREEGWEVGPGFGFPLPLFDRGQGRKAAIEAEIRQAQANYYGLAVDVRSTTRAVRQQLVTNHAIARHYQDVIVPLSTQVSAGMREQYNAMQVGVFQLLVAQQEEVKAGVAYIESLRNYWVTRTAYEALLQGVMRTAPPMAKSAPGMASSATTDIH